MSSPNLLSLFCALLLCLPLAGVFILNTAPTTTTTSSSGADDGGGDGDTMSIPAIPLPDARFDVRANHEARILESRITVDEPPPPPVIANAKEDASRPPPAPVSDDDAEDEALFRVAFRDSSASYPPPPPPPPPVSYDEAEDEALFRVAARVSPKPKRPKKLAFMFLTTTGLPFARLWEAYFKNTPGELYNIYVHADPTRPDPTARPALHRRFPWPGHPVQAFQPAHPDAHLGGAPAARPRAPPRPGQHLDSPPVPVLRPAPLLQLHLPDPGHVAAELHRDTQERAGEVRPVAARGPDAMLSEVPLAHFRIGSQFWAPTRRHARAAVADTRLWSKFKLPCLRGYKCYPEGHYFPTLLSMRDPRGCVLGTLTHVDWRGRTDGQGRTYGAEEVGPELIRQLRSERPRYGDDGANGTDLLAHRRRDPFLFARKFAPGASRALMSIAEDVLFED